MNNANDNQSTTNALNLPQQATDAIEEVLSLSGPLRSIAASREQAERALQIAIDELGWDCDDEEILSGGYASMTEFRKAMATKLSSVQAALLSMRVEHEWATSRLKELLQQDGRRREEPAFSTFATKSVVKDHLLEFKTEQLIGDGRVVAAILTCGHSVNGRLAAVHLANTVLAQFALDANAELAAQHLAESEHPPSCERGATNTQNSEKAA